jgi:HK97 family phage portal protein
MGVINSLFEQRSTLANPDKALERFLLGGRVAGTYSGKEVTAETSVSTTAWGAAVMLMGEVMGSLPLHIVQQQDVGGRSISSVKRGHSLDSVLHYAANPEMSALEFRALIEDHLLNYGNFYAQVARNNKDEVVSLWPLDPSRMRVFRDKGSLVYLYETEDRKIAFKSGDGRLYHERVFCRDGITGTAPLAVLEQALALTMSVDEYAAKFFANSSAPMGVLETDLPLNDEGFARLKKDWEETYKAGKNAHQVAILEQGLKFKPLAFNPKDSQMLELRKFQVTEVSRVTRIPGHLLADLDRATFNNIEELGIGFVKYALVHRCIRTEQNIWRQLLTEQERKSGYGAKHNLKGLLRGDTKTQSEFYRTVFDLGAASPDDIREWEDMPPLPDGLGDIYTMQSARTTLDRIGQEPPKPEPQDEENGIRERRARATSRRDLQSSFVPVLADSGQRLVNIDANKIEQEGLKVLRDSGLGAFLLWLDTHKEFMAGEASKRIATPYSALGAALRSAIEEETGSQVTQEVLDEALAALVAGFAVRYATETAGQVQGLIRKAQDEGIEPAEAILTRVGEWREKRAEKIGKRESTLFGGALAKTLFLAAGISAFRWSTIGKNCPLCNAMDGAIVRGGQPFMKTGDSLEVEGAAPLKTSRNIPHPPLHSGCDCILSPA